MDSGAEVAYHAPYVPTFRVGGTALHRSQVTLRSTPLAEELAEADAAAIITGHSGVNYDQVIAGCEIVIDAVSVTSALAGRHGQVIPLGAPMPAVLA